MATTFDVIYLGVQARFDTAEGNTVAENGTALEGVTIGDVADPLFGNIQSLSPGSTGYSGGTLASAYDQNGTADTFSINGGADQTYDMGMAYKATLTYTDGTTAQITAIVFQDTAGNTYLGPQLSYNATQEAMEVQPVQSITLDTAVFTGRGGDEGYGLTADRYDATFATPDIVDGTAGADVINVGYVDADGDIVDGADGIDDTIYGYGGDDTIRGGAGNDTIGGWSEEGGNDLIYAGNGNDSVIAGAGNDTVYGGAGDDYLTGAQGTDWLYGETGNDVVSITDDHETTYAFGGEESGDTDMLVFANYSSTAGVTVTFSGDETGSFNFVATNGTGKFAEFEQVIGTGYDDTIDASASSVDQILNGGSGDDSITGGTGSDLMYGDAGDDSFIFEAGFGTDEVTGGETGEVAGDTLDASALTNGLKVTFSDTDTGTLSDGSNTVSFTGIENVVLGSGADYFSAGADLDGLTVDAGDGNDTLLGGTGSDTMSGGAGNDSMSGGSGDDEILAGTGQDTLYGGDGNDTLLGGAGTDFIYTEAGDDVVYGGDDLDVIFSGQGNDTVYGEGGDDILIVNGSEVSTTEVVGGETGETTGDTLILSGDGGYSPAVEVVYGGDETGKFDDGTNSGTFSGIERLNTSSGDDIVDASASKAGVDITTGSGADSVTGGAGADTIDADSGDDTIAGGAGDDVLTGGYGNDTFTFSDGHGDDIITDFDLADDDADGFTNDQLDLTSLTDSYGNPVNIWDVVVSDTVGDGTGDARLTFPNGESLTLTNIDPAALDTAMMQAMGIPCLAAGTLIDTPEGGRLVEHLRPGDLVTTTNDPAPVAWTANRKLGAGTLADQPRLRPVRIRAGALGNWRDLLVSPQHRIALGPAHDPTGFAPARWLADDGDGRFRVARGLRTVTYVHLLLPEHALIRAEGAWVESFYPGPQGLAALDPAARVDLFARIPAFAKIRTRSDAKRAYGPLALSEIRRRDLARFLDVSPRPGLKVPRARPKARFQPVGSHPGRL